MKFGSNWIASFDTVTCLVSMISRKSQDKKTTYNVLCTQSVLLVIKHGNDSVIPCLDLFIPVYCLELLFQKIYSASKPS